MCPAKIVEYFLIATGFIFVAFEIYLSMNDIDNDSSNIILYEATKKRLLFIPFAIGAITGHLFFGHSTEILPQTNLIQSIDNEFLVVLMLFIISLLLNIISKYIKTRSKLFITFFLILGILYGHFFWSMKTKNYTKNPNETCYLISNIRATIE